jgi:hypothetical protein
MAMLFGLLGRGFGRLGAARGKGGAAAGGGGGAGSPIGLLLILTQAYAHG